MVDLTILTTTYYPDTEEGRERANMALECMNSWARFIKFNGWKAELFIADDGSEINIIKWHSRQERKGIGASLNAGFKAIFELSDVALYIVDDWMLNDEINVDQWVDLLKHSERVGMVRIGPPHPDLTGKIEMFRDGFALVLDRHNYAYAMRPALYHKRFFDVYGWFQEGISCWECERLYNEHFCASEGPEIVYALPDYWEHKDILQLGQLEPEGGYCESCRGS